MRLISSPCPGRRPQAATHEHVLVPRDEVNVYVDHRHMGVGGDDSWSRVVYPEFQVSRGDYVWSVGLQVATAGDDGDRLAQDALLHAPSDVKAQVDR